MKKQLVAKINAAISAMGSVWEAEFMGDMNISQFDTARAELAAEVEKVFKPTNARDITVAVHNGVFHADDVICVALLQLVYGIEHVSIIRTRDESMLQNADYVLDVGGRDQFTEFQGSIWFDHHEPENQKKKHENGVYYAACGKLAVWLRFPHSLFDRALYAVEAQDNGQKELSLQFPNPFSFINTLNVEWDKNLYGQEQDQRFEEAVDMARVILKNILDSIELEEKAEAECEAAIAASTNAIVKLPRYIGGWQKYVCRYNEAHPCARKLLVLFPSGKNWNVQVVPVSENSFDSYLHLFYPGKRGKELDKATGLIHSVFCHAGAFLSGWQTEGMAYNFAMMCLLGEYDFWKWYNHKALSDYEAFLDLMDQDLPF